MHIFLEFPKKYTKGIELHAQTARLEIADLQGVGVEFSGRAEEAVVREVSGKVELDSNADLRVSLEAFSGRLDFNQISATSRVRVPEGWPFRAALRGMGNRIDYAIDGDRAEDFSDSEAENVIELNGMRSELLIEKRANKESPERGSLYLLNLRLRAHIPGRRRPFPQVFRMRAAWRVSMRSII